MCVVCEMKSRRSALMCKACRHWPTIAALLIIYTLLENNSYNFISQTKKRQPRHPSIWSIQNDCCYFNYLCSPTSKDVCFKKHPHMFFEVCVFSKEMWVLHAQGKTSPSCWWFEGLVAVVFWLVPCAFLRGFWEVSWVWEDLEHWKELAKVLQGLLPGQGEKNSPSNP